MTASRTAVANWSAQYRIAFCARTVLGTPMTSSNYATVTVDGSPHNVWDGNCYAFWATEGSTHPYDFSYTSSGSGATHRWFCAIPPSGTATAADSIVADYREQWWLEVNENGHSSPCIGSEGWFDTGTVAYACVNDSIIYDGETRYIFNHWSGDATGTQSSASSAMTMNTTHTAIANWLTQHRLTLTYSGTPVAPTMTGAGWYDEGTVVPISSEDPVWDGGVRYDFDTWLGAPVADPTSASTSITMDTAYTAEAQYTLAGAQLIVQTAGGPDSVRVDGMWYLSPCTMFVSLGSGHEIYVDSINNFSAGSRYLFVGWADGASTVLRNVIINAGTTFTANFITEHYIVVDNGGHGTPSGEGWYGEDSTATIQIDTIADESPRQRWRFEQWTGTTYSGTDNPATFTVSAPDTETAIWVRQYHFEVFSTYDDPIPPVGEHWFDEGTMQSGYVTSPDTIYHRTCVGYIGRGALPSGAGTSFSFLVTDSASVEWLWTN
ncbi:MAG TPA: hypothetical protein EYP14_16040, partial [Planctomycetaceae bacterium]|nr:hypothetical protein [Planctomycetaceae bacterium]